MMINDVKGIVINFTETNKTSLRENDAPLKLSFPSIYVSAQRLIQYGGVVWPADSQVRNHTVCNSSAN